MIDPVDRNTLDLAVTVPTPVPTPLRMAFQTNERHYTLLLIQDLFDQWIVVRSWSGRWTNKGASKMTAVPNYESGFKYFKEVVKIRERRGYGRCDC
jgi:hypothetical protein